MFYFNFFLAIWNSQINILIVCDILWLISCDYFFNVYSEITNYALWFSAIKV